MTKPAFLLADVDGTLVTKEKRLTPRASRAVQKLRAAGVHFSIVSGRPPRGLRPLAQELKLDAPYAAFNGGAILSADGSELHSRPLPSETVRDIGRIIQAHAIDLWVYTAKDWFLRDPSAPHVATEIRTVQFDPIVVPDFDRDLSPVLKLVAVCDDPEKLRACEKELKTKFGKQVSASLSQPDYLDVTHPDANKGVVIEELARLLGVPLSQTACIGDMANDLLMFRKAAIAIAMGNATDEVKRAATFRTNSNEEDGFAKAAERLLGSAGIKEVAA